jgi:hypothetical protein
VQQRHELAALVGDRPSTLASGAEQCRGGVEIPCQAHVLTTDQEGPKRFVNFARNHTFAS